MSHIKLVPLLLLLASTAASAQVLIEGTVVNADSNALAGATVEVSDSTRKLKYSAVTDSAGTFLIRIAHPGATRRLTIHGDMLGYRSTETMLDIEDRQRIELRLMMDVAAIPIEPLRVSARQRYTGGLREEYFARADQVRRLGGGTIIDYEQLQRRAGSTVNMIVAEQYPGMRNCPPAFFIDGMRATFDDLRMTSAMVVEGIEIYRTPAHVPAQYQSRATCGAVLIWTQIGDRGKGTPLSWRRVFITIGLIAGGWLLVQ